MTLSFADAWAAPRVAACAAHTAQSDCVADTGCAWQSAPPPAAPALGAAGGVPVTSCVPRVACDPSLSPMEGYAVHATVNVPSQNRIVPILLDGLAAPTRGAAAACVGGRAPGPCADTAVLAPGDNLPAAPAAGGGTAAPTLVVRQVLADWECSTSRAPPANAPCRRVPLDTSRCPYDPDAPGRQYVLEFQQPHGQPPNTDATVSLYCVPPAHAGVIFPNDAQKAVYENQFVPVEPPAPLCRALSMPGLDAHCQGDEGGACAVQEQIQRGCAAVFQRWNTHAATATNVGTGAAALTSVSSPLLRNRVTAFSSMTNKVFDGAAQQTARLCADFPRGLATQLMYENSDAATGNTGLPDPAGAAQALEPTAYSEYETPYSNHIVPVRPAGGDTILQNLQCLSQAPDQTTLQCTAYAKESDPTSSAAVYLQRPLMCTPPPALAEGDQDLTPNQARLRRGNADLQRAYRQCMATVLCQHNATYCDSEGDPYSPTWCGQHSTAACHADPLCFLQADTDTNCATVPPERCGQGQPNCKSQVNGCAWHENAGTHARAPGGPAAPGSCRAAAGTCRPLCLGRPEGACLESCDSMSGPECSGSKGQAHHCVRVGQNTCVHQCEHAMQGVPAYSQPTTCNDFTLNCMDDSITTAAQCRAQGQQGSCMWYAPLEMCVPTPARQVCSFDTTANRCLPANTPCQLDHQGSTDRCVPACTQSVGYNMGVANMAAQLCTAYSLLSSMQDVALYRVQPGKNIDGVVARWQHAALTDKPWSTMQLGEDSLTHALHTAAPALLDHATYGVGFKQAFAPVSDQAVGAISYLPPTFGQSIDTVPSTGETPACNVYQLTETCAGLEYACASYDNMPAAPEGEGVDVGGFSKDAGRATGGYTRRYHAAANLRPALELLHRRQQTQGPASTSLALTLDTPPWGCQHLPTCDTCCQEGNVLPCCQRGKCCPRQGGCPATV